MMKDLGKLIGFTALMQIPFRDDPDALAYLEEIRLALKELEAVRGHPGAVDIVRCKDCRWVVWVKNCRGENMVICSNKESPVSETNRVVKPDWYCADGERWEEDADGT